MVYKRKICPPKHTIIHVYKFLFRWVERSLTSLRIPSLDQETEEDNKNQVGKKEEENVEKADVEKGKEEKTEGKPAKLVRPIILILLFLIMLLLLLAAGLVILLKKEASSISSSQLTVSPTSQSSFKPQKEEDSTEAPSPSQSSITSSATYMDSSTPRIPVAQGTTYFPDPPPRAGSRLIL